MGAGNGANVTFRLDGGVATLRGVSAGDTEGGAGGGGVLAAGAGCTLRDGPGDGGGCCGAAEAGVVGVGGGGSVGGELATAVKMLVSWTNALWWLSVNGAKGEPDDGLWSA